MNRIMQAVDAWLNFPAIIHNDNAGQRIIYGDNQEAFDCKNRILYENRWKADWGKVTKPFVL